MDDHGNYKIDSEDLEWAMVYGSYRDQGCISVSPKGQASSNGYNHKGGDFKIKPQDLVKFLKEIGVILHFETDRKHSYCRKIELKPWSQFSQELRKPIDKSAPDNKIDE